MKELLNVFLHLYPQKRTEVNLGKIDDDQDGLINDLLITDALVREHLRKLSGNKALETDELGSSLRTTGDAYMHQLFHCLQ